MKKTIHGNWKIKKLGVYMTLLYISSEGTTNITGYVSMKKITN